MNDFQTPGYAVPNLAGPVRRRAGAELHILWFFALLAAMLLGSLATQALISLFGGVSGANIREFLIRQAAVAGALTGTAQWLVWRRYAPVSWAWIPVTMGASVASGAASGIILGSSLPGLLAALIGPIGQGLVLRQRLRGASVWMVAAALTLVLGSLLNGWMYQQIMGRFGTETAWIPASIIVLYHAAIQSSAARWILGRNDGGQAPPYPNYR
ncbi:MAG TPA: hypothetical protein VGE07_27945 [Herpetosiphonaceae bacterium]